MHFRARLLGSLWGYDFDPGTNVVDVTSAICATSSNPRLWKQFAGQGIDSREKCPAPLGRALTLRLTHRSDPNRTSGALTCCIRIITVLGSRRPSVNPPD